MSELHRHGERNHREPQKIEDLTFEDRIKTAESIARAAKSLQDQFLSMGMTTPAAGALAFELLLGPRSVEPQAFQDYNEGRDYRGGH